MLAWDSRPRFSIIIVNYNGAALLPGCLSSIAASVAPSSEIVVVDNGSSDESVRILAGYSWVKVVQSKQNLGFAGGNNLGLASCSGEYVLLLNNDTLVTPGSIQSLVAYLDSHPSVGVAQGKMVLPRQGGRLDVCGSFLTSSGLPYHYGYFKPDGPQYMRNYPVFSGKGAFLMFRRELISRIGGFLFDSDFFCYYEESDFCHRCWLAGSEVHFVSTPPIEHLSGATGKRILREDSIQNYYIRNMIFSLLSNLSATSLVRIMPLFFSILILRLFVFLLTLRGRSMLSLGSALLYNLRSWERVARRRQLIRNIRTRTDAEIFRLVLLNPRFDYFIKTFTGKIGEYRDQDLV